MKHSYYDKKGNNILVWSEDVSGQTYYWKKVNGLSYDITKSEYNRHLKKKTAI